MRQLTITQSITDRGSLSLDRYLQEIAKEEMITAEKEIELAQAIRGGDKKALDTLTKANLRFVVSVAKQYRSHGLSLPDLINEGNLGLIKAAQRFDETKGFKFISYAVWWIRQSIIQALGDQSRMVRLPSNKVNLGNRMKLAASLLEQVHERQPSSEELAAEMQVSEKELQLLADYQTNYVSLDSPNPVTEESMIETMIDEKAKGTDDNVEHRQSLAIELKRCLRSLPEREREIISSFFGVDGSSTMSLSEIAVKHQMTSERVRQLKDKAISHLRDTKRSRLLKEYL